MTFIIADSLGKTTYKEMQDFYKDLFIGENSVPKELLALKNVIEGNVAINELEPDIAHRLTKSRTLSETDNISLFNKAFNIQELDVIESDLYSLGVEPNDTNKKFLYRLMLHSIFQSGFTNAANSYMKVIPNRIFIDVAEKAVAKFSAMTSEAKRAKLNSFYEQLFRNSVSNPDIVPRYPWTTRASRKTGYWFPKTYPDKRGYYSNYDYIAFNYYTHQPFSYWRSNKSAPTSVVLYKRVGANTFEFISKQGEGIRMREYYPMLNAGEIDNVTIVEASRYNKLPLDVVYAEEPIQNDEVSGKDINDEELPFGENIHKFDVNKLSGRDFDFIGEDQNNSYYKVLGKESTMHRALRMIENKSTNPSRVQLAKVLKSALSTAVPLYIQKKNFEKELDPDTGRPASVGAYDYNDKKAYVYEKLDDIGFEVATLHEAMHALSHNELEKNPEFKKRIQKMADHTYEYALKNFGKNIIQKTYDILTDPHEFISWGFTSSNFQSLLAVTPSENPEMVEGKSKEISVLKEFMGSLLDIIKRFFNTTFGITHSEYNKELQGMESVLKELILVVDEGLSEELKTQPIINVIGNQSSSNDEIKVINREELNKEDNTDFNKLYPQYEYLSGMEKNIFQDAVNKGIIKIACGL